MPVKINKSDFANRLKKLREKKGLTQEAAAKKIGVSRTAYQNWESETSQKLPRDLNRLLTACALYEVKPYYLMTGLFDEDGNREHEKVYKTIYSRYKNNPDFFILISGIMLMSDSEVAWFAALLESFYNKPLASR